MGSLKYEKNTGEFLSRRYGSTQDYSWLLRQIQEKKPEGRLTARGAKEYPKTFARKSK